MHVRLNSSISFLIIIFSCFLSCSSEAIDDDPRPNVVLIVADDLGYSDLGCFGSEIHTPNIDTLAKRGRIFINFYTAATCSPTRAMLLAGVDHHLAGLGDMAERMVSIPEEVGQPGYEGYLNDRVISFVQLVKDAGYHTYMAGKWHLGLTPDQSPLAKGFEKSFALMDAYADHFYPDPQYFTFWEDDDYGHFPPGNYSTDYYTEKMINFIRKDRKSQKPFFLYAAYTSPHWPLQAPDEFIRKYRGTYDVGFNELRRRRFQGLKDKGLLNDSVIMPPLPAFKGNLYDISDKPLLAWDSLNSSEKAIEARKMEIYAGMIDNLDFNIGRLINYLKEIEEYDNTLFIFLSDNGPAALDANEVHDPDQQLEEMGSANSFVAYGPQWAHASSAVNRYYKGYSSEGGIHSPLIIKLPGQTGEMGHASAFSTVCDLAPTILELAGVNYPAEYNGKSTMPLQGESMLPYLKGEVDEIHLEDFVAGWELFGRCAVRKGPWKITKIEPPFGSGAFELYNLENDPTETKNLAEIHLAKVQEMMIHWETYVRQNAVILRDP
ncbi:MAG: arylsulfatase [Saprospiraceae bacterium]|nr:arylsulfatase [Saprospiraceae bacterium]